MGPWKTVAQCVFYPASFDFGFQLIQCIVALLAPTLQEKCFSPRIITRFAPSGIEGFAIVEQELARHEE